MEGLSKKEKLFKDKDNSVLIMAVEGRGVGGCGRELGGINGNRKKKHNKK